MYGILKELTTTLLSLKCSEMGIGAVKRARGTRNIQMATSWCKKSLSLSTPVQPTVKHSCPPDKLWRMGNPVCLPTEGFVENGAGQKSPTCLVAHLEVMKAPLGRASRCFLCNTSRELLFALKRSLCLPSFSSPGSNLL